MKKGAILLAVVIIVGITFSSAWTQSIEDIYWTPVSPVVGRRVTFHVKVSNPGPQAPICIKLLTPGGAPVEQTHAGIGIRVAPPIDVGFGSPVVYAAPGAYEVKALLLTNDCKNELKKGEKPIIRTERIKIETPAK